MKKEKNIYANYFIMRLKVSYGLSKFILIPVSIILIILGILFVFNKNYSNNISISLLIIGLILLIIGIINVIFIPRYIKRFEKKLKNR
jgi:uncharacterized membrane protein